MSFYLNYSVTFSQFVRFERSCDLSYCNLDFHFIENYKKRFKMGLFNKIFGSSGEAKEEKILPWIPLNDLQQLNHLENKSTTKTQVVFKHSTRCGISRMVMNQFVDAYNLTEKDLDLYYLDLLSYREISNEIAAKFQVMHESPQLLVIKNGVVVAQDSHGAINSIDLNRFV